MKSIITRISLVPEGEPIFHEAVTHIEVEDEAAGPFMVIRQYHDFADCPHEIRLDIGEIPEFIEAVRDIQASIEELENNNEDF